MTAARLTAAQKRHLADMLNEDGGTRYWRPWGQGERACAESLRRKGLLRGSVVTANDAYSLTDAGVQAAKEVSEQKGEQP